MSIHVKEINEPKVIKEISSFSVKLVIIEGYAKPVITVENPAGIPTKDLVDQCLVVVKLLSGFPDKP